jgi:hypothetical protein
MDFNRSVVIWTDRPAIAASVRQAGALVLIAVTWSDDYAARPPRAGDLVTLDGQAHRVAALALDRETADGPLLWVLSCTVEHA